MYRVGNGSLTNGWWSSPANPSCLCASWPVSSTHDWSSFFPFLPANKGLWDGEKITDDLCFAFLFNHRMFSSALFNQILRYSRDRTTTKRSKPSGCLLHSLLELARIFPFSRCFKTFFWNSLQTSLDLIVPFFHLSLWLKFNSFVT